MELEVKITTITHSKQNKKDYWLRLLTDKGVCCGKMSWEPKVNDLLTLNGSWDVFSGQKIFKFTFAKVNIIEDKEAKVKYLCSITAGLGESTADNIYNKFGDDWENILSEQKEEFLEIKGITKKRLNNLLEEYAYIKNHETMSKIIIAFMSRNITQTDAVKAFGKWDKSAVSVIDSDVYKLTDLEGIGFIKVDTMYRHYYKITDDDPRRIKACIKYSLQDIISKTGSNFIDITELIFKIKEMILMDNQTILDYIVEIPDIKVLDDKICLQHHYSFDLIIWEYAKC